MSVAPARAIALKVLAAARERDAYVAPLLEARLGASGLSEADRALATRLVRGVTETLGVLDESIDGRLNKARSLEPRVRDALRLAAYELLFMRTPSHAVVHQGVEAVRRVRPQASGLANALLRRLAADAETFPWGDVDHDLSALARATGHPWWLAEMVARDEGDEAARRMLLAGGQPAPLYLRHDPFVAPLDEALAVLRADGAEPAAAPPDGLSFVVRDERAAVRGSALADGYFVVTDAAAQLAPLAVAPAPASTVLDAGAGRGTKTIALQALAVASGGPARIVSLDLHEFKTRLLRERMDALGIPGITAVTADMLAPVGVPVPADGFDAVLLDAPCTGLGTLRRHPELRWRVQAADVERMAELQSRMLEAAASLVRPGGHVVYSTCSVARAENDRVVEGFLGKHGDTFRTSSIARIVPDEWQRFVTPEGWFRGMPESAGPDGHFVARLERQDAER